MKHLGLKRFNSKVVLLIVVSFFLLIQCSKYKEEMPFLDGMFLEYKIMSKTIIFNVYLLENEKYKVVRTYKSKAFGDKVRELFVNRYGKVNKSSFKDYEGKFSPIWIPVHEMEIGDSFDGGYTVLRKDQWRKWGVLVIKNPDFEEEQYYELSTGYFVGAKGRSRGAYEVVLINTNADIPTIEE